MSSMASRADDLRNRMIANNLRSNNNWLNEQLGAEASTTKISKKCSSMFDLSKAYTDAAARQIDRNAVAAAYYDAAAVLAYHAYDQCTLGRDTDFIGYLSSILANRANLLRYW